MARSLERFVARRPGVADARRCAILLAIVALASTLALPASAQFFGDRYPGYQPSYRQPPSRDFFSFPFFRGSPYSYRPFIRPPQPVESTKAPPPRKLETTPTSTVVVVGDSLADWLAYGLEETYADQPDIGVVRNIRASSGLVRYELHNDTLTWSQAIKDVLATEKPTAIVVMLGLNDRLPLRDTAPPRSGTQPAANGAAASQAQPKSSTGAPDVVQQEVDQPPGSSTAQRPVPGGLYDFRTDQWADLYAKRVDEMIAALKTKGVPVLWVGLPAIRGSRGTADMSYLDELYRARADRAGIIYVDIWDGFVDENGRYAVQGPDFEGQIRRLRTGDGVHFTKVGAVKLAHYVEHELSRVMASHVVPVALTGPEQPSSAKAVKGGAPPAIGPVLPLTASVGDTTDLLGGGNRPASEQASDPIATRVLSRGDAVAAPSGRADNFAWPRPGAAAVETPGTTPQPVTLTPPAASKSTASRNDGKKRIDGKADAKADAKGDVKSGKAAPDGPAAHARRATGASLDGGPQ